MPLQKCWTVNLKGCGNTEIKDCRRLAVLAVNRWTGWLCDNAAIISNHDRPHGNLPSPPRRRRSRTPAASHVSPANFHLLSYPCASDPESSRAWFCWTVVHRSNKTPDERSSLGTASLPTQCARKRIGEGLILDIYPTPQGLFTANQRRLWLYPSTWIDSKRFPWVWGNGATFDLVYQDSLWALYFREEGV